MQIKTAVGQAMNRKYPEPIAIAVAKDAQGKYNPITLGWIMPSSGEPPMLAIAVAYARHSYQAIRQSREFVIALPSSSMAKDALFHGTHSGREMDKLAVCETRTQRASAIDCVLLAEAVANFECVLESETKSGDHAIFVGRIVAAHMHSDRTARRLYTVGPNHQMSGVIPG